MIDIVNFTYSYTDSDRNFDIKFKPVTRPLMPWVDEISNTLKTIRASTDKPLFLCLSGGIDGELIARACLQNNIYFEVITLRHIKGTNAQDISYAIDFCKKYNLKHHIIDFDIEKFIIEEIPQYISQGYVSWRPFRFQQIRLFEIAESMGGVALLGGGDQQYATIDGTICVNFKDDFFMCLEWLRRNNKTHFPYVFMQNPEIFAAYMQIDLINFLLNDPSFFVSVKYNIVLEKITVYHRYFPDMPRRRKLTGFESFPETALFKNYVFKREQDMGGLRELEIPVSTMKQQLGI